MVVLRGLGELFLRISIFDPGERQERLRNDPSESQENWKFELWDASGGLRETRNPSNRLAGAKENSRPSVRRKGCKIPWAAWTSQTAAFHSPGISPLLSMRFLAATASV